MTVEGQRDAKLRRRLEQELYGLADLEPRVRSCGVGARDRDSAECQSAWRLLRDGQRERRQPRSGWARHVTVRFVIAPAAGSGV